MSRREGEGRREEKQGGLCREALEKREIRADKEGKLWERWISYRAEKDVWIVLRVDLIATSQAA